MKRLTSAWSSLLVALSAPLPAYAQDITGQARNPQQTNLQSVIDILVAVIKFGLSFAAAIGAIFIVINGYQYIFSAGNPEKIEKAKQGLTWSIGGFILAISSVAIVTLLEQTLNSDREARVTEQVGGNAGAGDSAATIIEQLGVLLFLWGGGVAVLFLILGGYRYITSQGNQDQIEVAKKTILYSIIGLVVLFASFLIYQLVADTVLSK